MYVIFFSICARIQVTRHAVKNWRKLSNHDVISSMEKFTNGGRSILRAQEMHAAMLTYLAFVRNIFIQAHIRRTTDGKAEKRRGF